ncbi:iron donor protein CyaY [Viridibacterium curvum]|uniref:Iron-sulfur cluster assembly protein CyaY n=1 Tax=Viridibacterium curvum TaxID=1101404 RepID=A0ABP9QI05_9RHOO
MDEKTFLDLADAQMAKLEQVIEQAADDADLDLDIEARPGGILELSFPNGSKMVINRHAAAREIWVAAKSGGFHYRPEGGQWLNTRDGEELHAALSRLLSEQAGQPLAI